MYTLTERALMPLITMRYKMTKLINRDEAILELAKGRTVTWGRVISYKMKGNQLFTNHAWAGFADTGHNYVASDKHKTCLHRNVNSDSYREVEREVKRYLSTQQAKPTTKLNGQNKAVTAQLIKSLSEVFGVKDQVFKVEPVKLYRLGNYMLPLKGTIEDLSEYFIDEDGDLYSKNDDTYFTKYGVVLTKLSNDARDNSLRVVNSLRAKSGNKVTIYRDKLIMMRNRGELEDVTMLPNSVHMIHMPTGDEVRTSDFAL